jgi:hypothetical protein
MRQIYDLPSGVTVEFKADPVRNDKVQMSWTSERWGHQPPGWRFTHPDRWDFIQAYYAALEEFKETTWN